MEPMKLCGNDVWVLQALGGGAGETWPLAKVIAHADALNHAILSYAELCRAVARLRALDLIVVDGERCGHSEAGRQLVNSCRSRGVFDTRDELEKRLGAGPWEPSARIPEPSPAEQFVTREQYEAAVRLYLRRY